MGTDRCVGARLRSLRSLRPVPTRGPVVLTRTSAPLRIVKKACSVRLPLTPSITGQAKQLFFCNLTESDLRSDSPVV